MRLILIRNGNCVDNKFHTFANNRLTTIGEGYATSLIPKLVGYNISEILTSPINRAMATAHVIGSGIGLRYTTSQALLPWNIGSYEDMPIEKYISNINYCIYHPNDKVPTGQSINQWAKPFLNLFNELIKTREPRTTLIVTHGWNIALAHAHKFENYHKGRFNKEAFRIALDNHLQSQSPHIFTSESVEVIHHGEQVNDYSENRTG